jgi:hypothetical protein
MQIAVVFCETSNPKNWPPFENFRLLTFALVFIIVADIASLFRGKRRDFLIVLSSLAFGTFCINAEITPPSNSRHFCFGTLAEAGIAEVLSRAFVSSELAAALAPCLCGRQEYYKRNAITSH